MPAQAATTRPDETWSGLLSGGTLPDYFHKRDELGKLAYIEKGEAKFMQILSTQFSKSKVVNDREFKTSELHELSRQFFVTIPSTSDDGHTSFGITNTQAQELTSEDVLILTNTYAEVAYTDLFAGQVTLPNNQVPSVPFTPPHLNYDIGAMPSGVLFSRTWGSNAAGTQIFGSYEQVQITRIGAPDSAGVGHTRVYVERCYMGAHARDKGGSLLNRGLVATSITADAANATIGFGDIALRALPAFSEGTGAPTGFYKNPEFITNYTQEFKYAVEKTTESDIVYDNAMYDPDTIRRRLTNKRMVLDVERTYLFGRKTRIRDRDGKEKFLTGGIVEYIPKDSDHYLRYNQPTLNYKGLLDITLPVFRLGGSSEKMGLVSPELYIEFKKAFYDTGYLRYDKTQTARFDIPIESIMGAAGIINLVPMYSMWEAGYRNTMIVLDMGVPSFIPVTNKGWDMKYDTIKTPNGVQIVKEQVIGMKGLERNYGQYHCMIDFPI